MSIIKVAVHGASGRMGREVLAAVCREPDMEPVAAVSRGAKEDYLSLPDNGGLIPYGRSLEQVLPRSRPHVVVDFTNAEASMQATQTATRNGVHMVIGTTGFSESQLQEMEQLSQRHRVGIILAPNFSLGAVILTHLARIAAAFFDYAEILEVHHHQKADAPSGTSLALARAMLQGRGKAFEHPEPQRETLEGTRGGNLQGIAIHSGRMPGRLAFHEVTFGGPGETLVLRHDAISRECYIPGVLRAIREVVKFRGLVVGLEKILGLE